MYQFAALLEFLVTTITHLSIMPNCLRILRLKDTTFPVFLLGIPQFARLSVWVGPSPGAAGKVLSLPLLVELI